MEEDEDVEEWEAQSDGSFLRVYHPDFRSLGLEASLETLGLRRDSGWGSTHTKRARSTAAGARTAATTAPTAAQPAAGPSRLVSAEYDEESDDESEGEEEEEAEEEADRASGGELPVGAQTGVEAPAFAGGAETASARHSMMECEALSARDGAPPRPEQPVPPPKRPKVKP